MKTKREIIAAASFSVLIGVLSACSASAADKEFVVHATNNVTGDDASALQLTYELQNIDGSVVSSKTSSEQDIVFDPIILDDADNTSHFYKIVQKNDAIDGVSYDGKTVYVRIVPKQNLLAYQDDTTYKYVNDGTGPHPYHATEEELQGQAYAVYDSETKILTFFRDEPGKYTDMQVIGSKTYYTDFEENITDDYYRAPRPSWQTDDTVSRNTIEVRFDNPIRPVGVMSGWFAYFRNLEKADFSKLDTSRVVFMGSFCQECEKLDADISHLDLSNIRLERGYSGLTHFMKQANVSEFDFNNYGFNMEIPDGAYPFESMFGSSGLRYLNTVPLKHNGTSGMFSNMDCLERLVVGSDFTFYRGIPTTADQWLKIETGKVATLPDHFLYDNAGNSITPVNPLAAGNYVRPTCNVTPATFSAKYVKPIAPVTPAEDGIDNPNTSDNIAKNYLILITAAALLVLVVTAKMKGEIK